MGGLVHKNIEEMRLPAMTDWRASDWETLGSVGGGVEACPPGS